MLSSQFNEMEKKTVMEYNLWNYKKYVRPRNL